MPSSVNVGVRPSMATMRSNSWGVSPCSATRAGVMAGSPALGRGRGDDAGTRGARLAARDPGGVRLDERRGPDRGSWPNAVARRIAVRRAHVRRIRLIGDNARVAWRLDGRTRLDEDNATAMGAVVRRSGTNRLRGKAAQLDRRQGLRRRAHAGEGALGRSKDGVGHDVLVQDDDVGDATLPRASVVVEEIGEGPEMTLLTGLTQARRDLLPRHTRID